MRRNTILVLLTALIIGYSSAAFSQFQPRGGWRDSRSEAREGRGGDRDGSRAEGRMEGRNESRWERSQRGDRTERDNDRSARIERFLRGMDADGDGVVRENEVPPEYRQMFGFLAARLGQDPAKGIVLNQLGAALSRRPGDNASRRDGGDGSEQDSSRNKQGQEESLVPGFGNEHQVKQVPGFGPPDETAAQSDQSAQQRDRPPGWRGETGGSESGGAEPGPPTDGASAGPSSSAPPRFASPQERLPKGLPSWFIERDEDMDGQVSMAEFAKEWTDAKVKEFFRYDKNRDGIITPEECLNPGGGNSATAGAPSSGAAPSGSAPVRPNPPAERGGTSNEGRPKPWWMQ